MMVPAHLRPELARLGALWQGHDAGCYQLPAALLKTRTALDRLLAAPDPATEDTGVQERLIAATVAAAHNGADFPSVDVLLDAELDQQRAALRGRVLVEAVERVASQLIVDTQRNGSTLLAEHLRPALDSLLDKLRPHAKVVVNLDPEGALRAGGQASKAWLTFDRGAEEYRALRAARQSLALVGVAAAEDTGLFAEIRNLPDVWPDHRPVYGRTPPPPWPEDPRRRLAWLLANGADIWMPTPAEQDDIYGEWLAAERQRNSSHAPGTLVG
jgi:hypothetical protein